MSLFGESDNEQHGGGYDSEFEGFDPEATVQDASNLRGLREEDYGERLKAAGKAIKSKRSYVTQADLDNFFDEFGDIAGRSFIKGVGNILHTLVEVVQHTDDIEPSQMELLLRQLVKEYPHLLQFSNKDGFNPLLMATRNSQNELVQYMVSECVLGAQGGGEHGDCLAEAMSQQEQAGNACLHVAIKERLDPATVRLLIENATDEVLALRGESGRTPMHLAVDFRQYTDERASLVALFVERDLMSLRSNPAPRATFLDLADHGGLSVYQEHERTRLVVTKEYDDWLQKRSDPEKSKRDKAVNSMEPPSKPTAREPRAAASSKEVATRRDGPARATGDRGADRTERGAEKELDERELLRQKKKAEEAARLKDGLLSAKAGLREDRDGPGRDNSRARPARASDLPGNLAQLNTAAKNPEPAPNTPIKRSNTTRFDAKPAQDPVQEKPKPRPSIKPKPSRKKASMPERWKNSDALLLTLKLHYMRTRNEEMALSFLYGANHHDVRISFDYDRLPRKLVWSDFTNRLGKDHSSGIKFDRVLQYVSFPHVEVTERGVRADREREAELKTGIRQLGGLGRKDMKFFFNWLHSKGVRHIIQLSVEDSGDANGKVHSDQAIQDSLERFVVDSLDWRKMDLDPETILHVGSKAVQKEQPAPEESQDAMISPEAQLKQLYLRWSGSNAVLRAWGSQDGLAMLPRLETIYLFRPSSEKVRPKVRLEKTAEC
jgi:hypothetical protein